MSSVGLVGKAPCQADFLRISAADPICQQLLSYLEQAAAPLRQAGNWALPVPVFFLYALKDQPRALLGALCSSEDEVGRTFPLAVFAILQAEVASRTYSSLPAAARPFLEGAAALLKDARGLSSAELTQRLSALSTLAPDAESAPRAALSEPSDGLLSLLRQGGSVDLPYYAFRTFLTACDNERASPGKAQVVLDCPLPPECGPTPWLELARRRLSNSACPPSFFWTGSPGRLLLCLSQPSTQALLYLARPDQTSLKLWPLTTRHEGAIATAKSSLSPSHRAALERPVGSLGELIATLST